MIRFSTFLTLMVLFSPISYAQNASVTDCSDEDLVPSRIVGGIEAEVISQNPVGVYEDPSTQAELVIQLSSGMSVFITSEAQCDGENIWWQVTFPESEASADDHGYILELIGGEYQLEPIFTTFDVPSAETLITSSNLDQLEQIAAIDYGWPLELIWSPDGSYLAINTLWSVWVHNLKEPDAMPRSFPAIAVSPWDGIGSMTFSLDSSLFATVALNGDLQLWPLSEAEPVIVDIQAENYNGVAAISTDLSKWAIAHTDGSISLWDAQIGDQIAILEGHVRVGALAFSPDGTKLISAGGEAGASSVNPRDMTLRLWDIATGDLQAMFELNGLLNVSLDPVQKITFSPDGTTAAFTVVNKDNGTATLSFLDINQIIYTAISLQDHYVRVAAFSPDGAVLAVGSGSYSRGEELIFIDAGGRSTLREVPVDDPVLSIAFNPGGTLLAVARELEFLSVGQVEIWAVPGVGESG